MTDTDPGVLRITGFDVYDSTIAGTFHFTIRFPASYPVRSTNFSRYFRIRPSHAP